MPVPAFVIAGTHSGSGKTTVTLAVLAALVRRGLRVQSFKIGPDFIDPGHHARITGRPGRNLDTWLLEPDALARTYRRATEGADLAVIEGVMGLFDGRGPADERGSTAHLARLWQLPVFLVVDAKGMARSMAAMVLGYARFDPMVNVAGVIANRVGSRKHFAEYLVPSLRSALADIEPLGFLARSERLEIPSRHLGLVTADDLDREPLFLEELGTTAEASLDLNRFLTLARHPRLGGEGEHQAPTPPRSSPKRIAVARDRAFCFYYEDNLDALCEAGAEIVPFSPIRDADLPPEISLLYLGGGYPELFGEELASNLTLRAKVREFHARGGRILAECGGLMICTESIRDRAGRVYPMWGLLPARVAMQTKFAALGYVTAVTERETIFGPRETTMRGHEFHYSTLEPLEALSYAVRIEREGEASRFDGIERDGLLAGYTHYHLGSNAEVASNILRRL